MLCEICKQEIVKRHTIHTLFRKDIHHICEYCYQQYPLLIKHSVLPIENGRLFWTSMIKTHDYVSSVAYMSFMKPFYITFLNHHQSCIYLYFDRLTTRIFTILDSMKLGDIYLLTLHENIDEEENNYDI